MECALELFCSLNARQLVAQYEDDWKTDSQRDSRPNAAHCRLWRRSASGRSALEVGLLFQADPLHITLDVHCVQHAFKPLCHLAPDWKISPSRPGVEVWEQQVA